MRRAHSISVLLVDLLFLVVVSSCNLEPNSRGAVNFSFKNGSHETKAVYSDVLTGGIPNYERIDWEEGDLIRIYCDEASAPSAKYCDYQVIDIQSPGVNSKYSDAKVTKYSAEDLCWSDGQTDHHFYCVYPAPDGSTTITQSVGENEIKGKVPRDQDKFEKKSTSTGHEVSPSLESYMLMAGYAMSKPIDKVDIDFYPITTCIDFTISNGTDKPLNIAKLELLSSDENGEEVLSGDFICTYDGDTNGFNCSKGSTTGNSVSISFTEENYISLPPDGTTLRFKFFVNPCNDLTNPIFKVTTYDDGALTVRKATLKPATGDFTVTKSHKTNITGLVVKEGFVILDFGDPVLASWDIIDKNVGFDDEYAYYQYFKDELTDDLSFTYQGGSSTIVEIVSYKIAYSDNTKKIPVDPIINVENGEWLNVDTQKIENDPPTYRITIVAPENLINIVENVDYHKERLSSTEQTFTDVSLYNPATGSVSTTRNTANCYVINAPGTYKIPMVYGNAIKNGVTNNQSFTSTKSGNRYLTTFQNHNGSSITSPYIQNVIGTSSTYSADIVWQDVNGLISNVGVNNEAIDATGNGFVTFTVDQNNIAQGNAILALKYGGTIVWSWHIWVTDDSLVPVNKFMPVNLGWCATDTSPIKYSCSDSRAASLDITINQEVRNVNVSQAGTVISYTNKYPSGNSPYYQWGRKDPISALSSKSLSSAINIATSVSNPGVFYSDTDDSSYDWLSSSLYNLWNANASTDVVIKTVYDPSPVGYCIPLNKDFSTLSNSRTKVNEPLGYIMSELYFPACGSMLYDGTIKGNSGSSLFGRYWTDRSSTGSNSYDNAYNMSFTSSNNPNVDYDNDEDEYGKANGMSIRCEVEN